MGTRFTVMSVPGDDRRGDLTSWFVMDLQTHRSVECVSYDEAVSLVRLLRKVAR